MAEPKGGRIKEILASDLVELGCVAQPMPVPRSHQPVSEIQKRSKKPGMVRLGDLHVCILALGSDQTVQPSFSAERTLTNDRDRGQIGRLGANPLSREAATRYHPGGGGFGWGVSELYFPRSG